MSDDHHSLAQPPVAAKQALWLADAEFLTGLGKRVRTERARRGITRKQLAREADVSERFLGQLESGEGNASVLLLRRVANALNVTLTEVFARDQQDTVQVRLIRRFIERLPPHRMEEVIFRLMRDFGHDESMRRRRIALIGLRGAGKSTLGNLLAKELGYPCTELNREIERDTGLPVSEIMALYGQAGYRRLERKALERVIAKQQQMVLVAAGGLVAEQDTFDLLLANCYTVWLKAAPEEHMARVLAQGDFRPMSGNEEAMQDLQRILQSREALYRKADAVVDTSGETPAESLLKLRSSIAV